MDIIWAVLGSLIIKRPEVISSCEQEDGDRRKKFALGSKLKRPELCGSGCTKDGIIIINKSLVVFTACYY